MIPISSSFFIRLVVTLLWRFRSTLDCPHHPSYLSLSFEIFTKCSKVSLQFRRYQSLPAIHKSQKSPFHRLAVVSASHKLTLWQYARQNIFIHHDLLNLSFEGSSQVPTDSNPFSASNFFHGFSLKFGS